MTAETRRRAQRPPDRLAHGGGCGCKLAPSVLQAMLAEQPQAAAFASCWSDRDGDDAAVRQVDERTCVIATTDFFMPMVDDPRDFGRIAATNAISDVYAMGGRPVMALAVLGMPLRQAAGRDRPPDPRGRRRECRHRRRYEEEDGVAPTRCWRWTGATRIRRHRRPRRSSRS